MRFAYFLIAWFCVLARTFAALPDSSLADTASLYRLTNECTWISAGHHHTYDDYLSPLLYQGRQFSAGFEQIRYFSAGSQRFSRYDGLKLHFAQDNNPGLNSVMTSAYVRGFYGAHFHLRPFDGLKLMPGAYSNIDLGAKYLPHNGNNPANVIGNANLWLSFLSSWSFSVGKFPLRLSNHFSAACLGLMFSPRYTQLYYDIAYIDDYDGNFVATSFARRFQVRNLFSADFNVSRLATVRVGFLAERLKYEVSGLHGRNLDMSFVIGIVKNFYSFKGNRHIPSSFLNPLQ